MSQTQSFHPNAGKSATQFNVTNRQSGLMQNSSGQISLFDQTLSPTKATKRSGPNSMKNSQVAVKNPAAQTVRLQTARTMVNPNKDLEAPEVNRVELI